MKTLLIYSIRLYQKTISPDHGLMRYKYPHGFCRFYPSCSEYAIQSLQAKPLRYATIDIIKRVLTCNPWSAPQIDKP